MMFFRFQVDFLRQVMIEGHAAVSLRGSLLETIDEVDTLTMGCYWADWYWNGYTDMDESDETTTR